VRLRSDGVIGLFGLVALALGGAVSGAQAPSGSLVQLAGRAGCLRAAANGESCGRAVAIGGGPVVASRDGRSVYVAGQTSVAAFARSPSGVLRQLGGRRGCIDYHLVVGEPRANASCAPGKLLWPTSTALSPDGRNLYVASWAFDPHGDRSDNYSDLAVFARDRATGALRQLPGSQGCLGPSTRGGCTAGRALYGPGSVVVSPDGHDVYTGSEGGIAVFARNGRSGALRQLAGSAGCLLAPARAARCSHRGAGALRQLSPAVIAVSSDGRNVYVLSSSDDRAALLAFRRNRSSGALTRLAGRTGCFATPALAAAGCSPAASLTGPWFCFSLAVSPNGRNLYVGSCGDLTIFSRSADGGLTQTGCIDANGPPGRPCAGNTGTQPQTSIAITPDGKNLYFAFNIGRTNPTTHTAATGGITAFARAGDGSLTRVAGTAGCLTETGSHGACTKARGLESPHELALSPDGHNLYSSGFAGQYCCRDGDVGVFRRAP
jgi:DNA-binding beta-propeller fold protein YncE